MNTNEYFLKISEYCNLNCVTEVLNNRKKLRKILGIENRKELDNVLYDISVNFSDYVFKNYKKFPKDEVAQLIATTCDYDFKCMLETLKDYHMQEDMLDYLFDYLKKNYDVEPIVKHIIDALEDCFDSYSLDPEGLEGHVVELPDIIYIEDFSNRPEIGAFVAMIVDTLPCTLCWYFQDMASAFQRAYEKVFGDVPDDIADKIYEVVDAIRERVEDRLREIAKSIYDEILNLANNNPEKYKIVGYKECDNYLCRLLGLDKIPLVLVEENIQQQEE